MKNDLDVVLEYIRENPDASRIEICMGTGFGMMTVDLAIRELVKEDLITRAEPWAPS